MKKEFGFKDLKVLNLNGSEKPGQRFQKHLLIAIIRVRLSALTRTILMRCS